MPTESAAPLAEARSIVAHDGPVRLWLLAIAALVFCMIVVGGATRLTGSGLSITEWQPILGAMPPFGDADWQEAFAKYKLIPQYERLNKGMSLAAFKAIYLWEWGHRFLGRIIGLAFGLPLLWFWAAGRLRPGLRRQLLGILALGGLQGGVGWYMVKSGLVDRVDVSQYRLALHLTMAFLILSALVWAWLSLVPERRRATRPAPASGAHAAAWLLLALLTVQIVSGALVAGLKAGLAYNTWPLMDGAIAPPGLLVMSPWWLNPFENAMTVQFDHRMLAYLLLGLSGWQAVRLSPTGGDVTRSAVALLAAMISQALLGIWTLLAHVPLSLGLAHQGGAAIVYVIAVWHVHAMTRASMGGGR